MRNNTQHSHFKGRPMNAPTETAPTANGKAPIFLMVALGAIFFDESGVLGTGNVRGEWEYDTAPNAKFKAATGDGKAGLYEDVEQNGLTTPLWIDTLTNAEREFLHTKTGVWYDYVCLRGHRRGRVLKQLAAKFPGRFDSIPCQVYGGLETAERVNLMVDQIHVKGLSDWGIYLAIKALAFARLTEPQIATRIGMSRGFVQAKLRVARLPQLVETEFLKKCKGQPAVNLTDKNLNALMMAQNADEAKGLRNEDGNGTPSFKAEWAMIAETGKQTNATPTAMNRKELLVIAGMARDPIIADTLRYAAGDPVQLPAITNALETLRTQAGAYVALMANDPASNPPVEAVNPAEPEPAPVEAVNPAEPAPVEAEPVSVESINTDVLNVRSDDNPAEPAPVEAEPAPAEPGDATVSVAESVMTGWKDSVNPAEPAPVEAVSAPFEAEPAPVEAVKPVLAPVGRGNGRKRR
jgi:hypothetical protein